MNGEIKILLVEDDDIIASGLCYTFEAEGYAVTHLDSAEAAIAAVSQKAFDIAVLDVTLPDGNGFDICKAIKAKQDLPVVFLTAVDDEGNTVKGFDLGADDYITKPFRIRELMARIKAVLRRADAHGEKESRIGGVLTIGDVNIHTSKGKVYKCGQELYLTASEYRLLLVFAMNPGQVLSRNRLLEVLWDSGGEFVNDNTLTVCIKRLREKLGDDPHEPKMIETLRGLGYRAGE